MNLSCLLSLIEEVAGYQQLKARLLEPQKGENRLVVLNAARPYVIAALFQELGLPILVLTAQPENAKKLYDQLQSWCPSSASLHFFPEADFMAGEYSAVDPVAVVERLRTLSSSTLCQDASSESRAPALTVSCAVAAASKTVPQADFAEACYTLQVGMDMDPLQLVEKWQAIGYELENLVEVPGTMGRRGGIVDVFSPNNELPARVEFFGNRIDSIRLFDPKTQRSSDLVNSVTVIPAKESQPHLNTDTILDYLPDKAVLITDDLDEIEAVIDKANSQAEEFRQAKVEHGELTSDSPTSFLHWAEFEGRIKKVKRRLTLCAWDVGAADDVFVQSLRLGPVPSYGGRLEAFAKDLKEMLDENRRIVIVSQQTNRLSELLQEQDILAHPVSQMEQVPPLRSATLVQGSLAEGWAIKDILTLLTDNEVFGFVKQQRSFKKRPIHHHWFVSELTAGDYVVHIEHGIARFGGLTRMLAEGVEREYLVLEYAAADRLYVPTDQIERVSRYIGAGDQPPTLSRFGTQEWARTKQRIRESVADIAQELLNLYAAREITPGLAFSQDSLWQQELESSFPYMETPDQLDAVEAVKADMEKSKPMDRLVCGDVGYGKTEVALRAAFKAVMDNKQVALLVPTTVLAQQHFATFRDRLQAFPVKVEMLSRFCSEKEQASIVEGLAAGVVDICIGTHRLLQKDVIFKDLGLIIIDEEQRFGVVHKEHFKKLRQEIDVLTLSATPIPRTLHMSLAGIRDMSTMETPPEERLPIKTYVGDYGDRLVREAILRELERNGQAFYVHNRVHSIALVADRLRSLVPEAKISVAHGQMPEEELERIMTEFVSRDSDVLVTTTIIESGLDMPNVNTLIVDQSDKLGLTQLYQLRGRVGRGSNHAHAYFLFDRGKELTTPARKRLRTISEATELGAGFGVAMRDLEIRGTGNLLGVEQSGYMAAVGFDLYCRLLAEAVEELRRKQTGQIRKQMPPLPAPTIILPMPAYVPEEYILTSSTKLDFYRRLAVVRQVEEIEDVARELKDRFGTVPQPVENLLYIVRMKQLATEAGVESIMAQDKKIVVRFHRVKELGWLPFAQNYKNGVKIGARQIRLDMKCLGDSWPVVLKEVLQGVVGST